MSGSTDLYINCIIISYNALSFSFRLSQNRLDILKKYITDIRHTKVNDKTKKHEGNPLQHPLLTVTISIRFIYAAASNTSADYNTAILLSLGQGDVNCNALLGMKVQHY